MTDVEPSPRTADEPMAFTADEFLRGVLASWLAFNLLFVVALLVLEALTHDPVWGPFGAEVGILLLYVLPLSLLVSGVVALLCCAAARAIGSRLRRTRSALPHVAAYGLLGATIGTVVVGGFQLATAHALDLANWLSLLTIASSAGAPPLGWAWTVRRARRSDAGLLRARHIDPDATAEDAL